MDKEGGILSKVYHLERLLSAMLQAQEEYNRHFSDYAKALVRSETVENTMLEKQRLLLRLVESLPSGHKYFYFCPPDWEEENEHIGSFCKECLYARVHRICAESGSSWSQINDCKRLLHRMIADRFYYGESYPEKLCPTRFLKKG